MTYLDNAATTYPNFRRSQYAEMFSDSWLNANSNSTANAHLRACRLHIKKLLGFKHGYVLFCRSSSEASNWLMNLVNQFGWECCVSPYEHDSVYNLRDVAVDEADFDKNTKYFGLFQMVNQMTGYVQDIKKVREKYPNITYLGCDLTATIGKYDLPKDLEEYVDAVWFDAHKIHGEGNMGCIWISDALFKLFNGTEDSRNEYGLIHGTPDVEGALMLVDALDMAIKNLNELERSAIMLNLALFDQLAHRGIPCDLPEAKDKNIVDKTPIINTIMLRGIDADALTQYLATKDVLVGKGASACADAKDYRVLEAYGVPKEKAETAIRISYNLNNSLYDIHNLVKYIVEFKKFFC